MLCVLLLVDTFKLLDAVSNALDFKDVIPEGVGNLDVVPLAFEKGCVVRYGVIRVVWRGDPGHNRKLLDLLGTCMEVGQWRLGIEKFDALDVLRTDRITPVGIKNVRYHTRLVGKSKADVACLLADDAHNATGILIEDDHADAKAEVLEVLAHTEEVTCEVVVQHKVIHLRLHLCGGKLCVIDKSAAIADFGVEHLASAHCLVRLDEINDIVRHLIVTSPRDVPHLVVDDDWCDVVLLLEDFRCLGGEGYCLVGAGDWYNGCRGCKRKIAHVLLF